MSTPCRVLVDLSGVRGKQVDRVLNYGSDWRMVEGCAVAGNWFTGETDLDGYRRMSRIVSCACIDVKK